MPAHPTSSDEAISLESAPTPHHEVPTLIADEHNRWCVDGRYQVYRDSKLLNDKGVMTRLLMVEQRVLTRSLHTVPAVHDLFTRQRLEWMVWSFASYSEDIV